MSDKVVITGTGLITAAGRGVSSLLDAMTSGEIFFNRNNQQPSRLPWPVSTVNWSDVAWPTGATWANNKKYANAAAHGAVAVAMQALDMSGVAAEKDAARCGTIMAIGSSGSDELTAVMPKLAALSETDPRPLPTLLYEEVPDYSYIRGIPSQLGQFVSMASGYRGSNVAVYGETSAGGLGALSLALRLIQSGELDRVIIVGVMPPIPASVLVATEREEPLGMEAIAGRGPFDVKRAGSFVGQGAVALVLEREETARARGAQPIAELVACETVTAATRREAIDEVSRLVLEQSDRQPEIWWACGAGSPAIDLEECRAVGRQISAPATSSKGTIGNAFECAALIDVALAVEALRQEQIPPIGLLEKPDPALGDIDFVVGLPRACPGARNALVTALGYGANTTAGAAMIARNLDR
jgi:3-oxoacyl-[acyl-carrier-protein] synthase II